MFVPNQNVDAIIAAEALGNVFAARTEPWLGISVALDCLRFFSLSLGQEIRWITGHGFYETISFTDIRSD